MFTIYPHIKKAKGAINRLIHRVIHIIHRRERAFLWKTYGIETKMCFVKKHENYGLKQNLHQIH